MEIHKWLKYFVLESSVTVLSRLFNGSTDSLVRAITRPVLLLTWVPLNRHRSSLASQTGYRVLSPWGEPERRVMYSIEKNVKNYLAAQDTTPHKCQHISAT